jgi:hypothetical protein
VSRPFTVAWSLWLLTCIVAELVGVGRGVWVALLLTAGVTETVALLRKADGDTKSEHVWWWAKDYPARRVQAGLFGLWFSYRIYSITPGGVGPALLTLAFAAWLIPHLATGGEAG